MRRVLMVGCAILNAAVGCFLLAYVPLATRAAPPLYLVAFGSAFVVLAVGLVLPGPLRQVTVIVAPLVPVLRRGDRARLAAEDRTAAGPTGD